MARCLSRGAAAPSRAARPGLRIRSVRHKAFVDGLQVGAIVDVTPDMSRGNGVGVISVRSSFVPYAHRRFQRRYSAANHQLAARPKEPQFLEGGLPPRL